MEPLDNFQPFDLPSLSLLEKGSPLFDELREGRSLSKHFQRKRKLLIRELDKTKRNIAKRTLKKINEGKNAVTNKALEKLNDSIKPSHLKRKERLLRAQAAEEKRQEELLKKPYDHPDGYRVFPNSSVDPRPEAHKNSGYAGPWIEEAFYKYFMKHKPKLNRTYIPVFWTDMQVGARGTELKTSFLKNLDPNKQYFTIVQHRRGIYTENIPKNVMIIGAGGPSDLCLPLLKDQPEEIVKKPKSYLCSFFGNFNTDEIRPQMKKHLKKLCREGSVVIREKDPAWKDYMQRSTFSLCPRGVGPTSFRTYEAISYNSIPIYIWNEEVLLPYQDEINWERDIAVLVHADEMHKLPQILESMSKQEIKHRQKMIEKYYKKYFTYHGACKYVCQKLKA
ncbi:MAG: hypothetical protein GWP59_06300 [Chlamydiales bacterium]|nr:hypothetical protein [Chlamydiales bacterium]